MKKLTAPITNGKLTVIPTDAASHGFKVTVLARQAGTPDGTLLPVTETRLIEFGSQGATMKIDLFTGLTWITPPTVDDKINYITEVTVVDLNGNESDVVRRDITVTGKDMAKYKKAVTAKTPHPPTPAAESAATNSAPLIVAPAPAPAAPVAANVPVPAPVGIKFPHEYWQLKKLLSKSLKNRIEELAGLNNTEFVAEAQAIGGEFDSLTVPAVTGGKKKMPTEAEVNVVVDKVNELLARVHTKCDALRPKSASAPAPAPAPAAAPAATGAAPVAANVPAPVIPVTTVAMAITATQQQTAAAKQPAPTIAAPKKVTPAANTTTAPAPAPAPVLPPAPPAPAAPAAAAPGTPVPTPPPSTPTSTPARKMSWFEWIMVGILAMILALICAGVWSKIADNKSKVATTATKNDNATKVACESGTNGQVNIHVARMSGDTSPISISGSINVGNSNSGTVIGVQNNYYTNLPLPEKVGAKQREAVNNSTDEAKPLESAKKVLRVTGWNPLPTVDCSRLVLVPRPEIMTEEITKDVYLEDGQIAILSIPRGWHYDLNASSDWITLDVIDEFCHKHVAGLSWPHEVVDRDQLEGRAPSCTSWMYPKNGKSATLHLKLVPASY